MSGQAKTSHLERTAAEPRDNDLHDVKLSRIDQVNERVRLFQLTTTGSLTFLPGQWVDTYVPATPKAGGFTLTSAPSAASPDSPTPHIELAVQESPDNAPAAWLWRPQDEILGSTIRVRVGGSFTFPPAGPVSRVVFVAGGVGVNPFMSMLSEIGHRAAGDVDVRTAYATKVPARGDVVFLDRIAGLYADGRVKGSFDLFATGEGTPPDGKGVATVHARRVAVADVERLVTEGNGDLASTYVYVCGPAAMTDEFVAGLTESGLRLDPGHVVTEKWW